MDILFLTLTISEENLKILDPHPLIRFNPKKDKINAMQFKNSLKNYTNSLILVKVKESEYNNYEYYGGFAPDSSIFSCSEESSWFKTEQKQQYNYPYTIDFNNKVKRKLVDKSKDVYGCSNSRYFQFNCDLCVWDQSGNFEFSFAYSNDVYKSIFEQENSDQKRFSKQQMQEIEIEVVKLF